MMIARVCAHIHNYFETDPNTGEAMIHTGSFTVEDGSIALPFLHAATQAPQPMHDAASIARSALCLLIGMALASGTPPVLTDTKPPACIILS